MRRTLIIGLLLLICLVYPCASAATYYYVSHGATGTWAGATNRSSPCSDSTANANAGAGDTVVYINDSGIFEQRQNIIEPSNNGSPGNPIVFKGEDNSTVILRAEKNDAYLVGKSYITIENFTFQNGGGNSWISMRNKDSGTTTQHITIQNCVFEATHYTWGGIYGSGNCNHIRILNNTIKGGWATSSGQGDVIFFVPATGYSVNHILIEGNDIEGGCHNALDMQTNGGTVEHIVIRHNSIHNPDHTSLNLYGSLGTRPQYCLVENNTIYDAGSICGVSSCPNNTCGSSEDKSRPREQHPNFQYAGNYSIVRNNIMYNGGRGFDVQNSCNDNRIYNNVFYNNVQGMYFNTAYDVDGNIVKNNIFKDNIIQGSVTNTPLSVDAFGSSCTNEWGYNNYDETNDIRYKTCQYSYGWVALSYLQASIPSIFHHEKQYSSGFVNPSGYDFRLQPDSPLVDAGDFLTRTNGSGNNSNTIIVDDARYFTDGWGLIAGDLIQLEGQNDLARITNVNYNNNTITIDQNISWIDGQGISLPYKGSAPDIGAEEYELGPAPPQGLSILQ